MLLSNGIQVLTPSRLLLNSFVKPALSSRENRCQKQSLPEPVRTNGQFVRVERLEQVMPFQQMLILQERNRLACLLGLPSF